MDDGLMVYAAASISAAAIPDTREIALKMTARDGDRDLFAAIRAQDVASLIAELRTEVSKMPLDVRADAAVPMTLTGALTASSGGKPLLLLQLDHSIELAVSMDPKLFRHLRSSLAAFSARDATASQRHQ